MFTPEERKIRSREAGKKWRRLHPEGAKAARRRSWAKHREKRNARTREYHVKNPDKVARWNKNRVEKNPKFSGCQKHGLSIEQFDEMVLRQGGMCAVCESEKKLYVDHCHTTDAIRGLLCHNCNVGIGHLRDSIAFLQKAKKYLEGGSLVFG
jgi:hypothetical protein